MALTILSAPLAATEPPGAWFLNAHNTGSDPYVYFSVGGTADVPPLAPDEVVLGWSWDESGTPIEPYPGRVPVRYRASALPGKKPYQWRAKSSRVGHPPIAVGPGRELLFLGDDARTTSNALRWAELLDVVEAAYRHSQPGLSRSERLGELEIGLLGDCRIRSRPVSGEGRGWTTLTLPGHARPSRAGGFYYVEQSRAPVERVGTIEVRRFLRRVEDGRHCSGDDLDLRLFPVPSGESFSFAYFLIWKDAAVVEAGLVDLAPEPMTPTVRQVAGRPGRALREQANVGRWPEGSRDLCRDPLVAGLCARDLEIRERLATSLGPDGLPAARERCRDVFNSLGVAGDPCSDPEVWTSKSGSYLAGYRGELPLYEDRLTSRVDEKGSVEWVWRGRGARGQVDFGLADGTRIRLGLPAEVPPDTELDATEPRTARRKSAEEPSVEEPAAEEVSDVEARADPPPPRPAAVTSPPPPPPPTNADSDPSDSSPTDSGGAFHGIPAIPWGDPKLLVTAPALLAVLTALVFLLRRSAASPRKRTSYVARVWSSSGGETHPRTNEEFLVSDLPLAPFDSDDLVIETTLTGPEDLPLAPPEEPAEAPPEPVPREPPPPPAEPLPSTPLSRFRDELNALDGPERLNLLRALDATRRLSEWVRAVLPVFREIEAGRGAVRFESLPLPARREWIDAYDTLRRFVERFPHQPLCDENGPEVHRYYVESGLLEPELSLKQRFRRHLLSHEESGGLVHGVVLALQYLLEAFPVEQLDVPGRKGYKKAVRDRLVLAGISPRLHDLVRDLAEGLGLRYQAVRYYKTEIGQEGYELLDDAHDSVSLSQRVGYEAGTDGPVVVRLTELFLVEASTGAPHSGRAAIDG